MRTYRPGKVPPHVSSPTISFGSMYQRAPAHPWFRILSVCLGGRPPVPGILHPCCYPLHNQHFGKFSCPTEQGNWTICIRVSVVVLPRLGDDGCYSTFPGGGEDTACEGLVKDIGHLGWVGTVPQQPGIAKGAVPTIRPICPSASWTGTSPMVGKAHCTARKTCSTACS
jgi:hypothetical protein